MNKKIKKAAAVAVAAAVATTTTLTVSAGWMPDGFAYSMGDAKGYNSIVFSTSTNAPLYDATHFHLFGLSSVTLQAHCNGNVATNDFIGRTQNFGNNQIANDEPYTNMYKGEVSYIRNFEDLVSGTIEDCLVFGKDVSASYYNNGNSLKITDNVTGHSSGLESHHAGAPTYTPMWGPNQFGNILQDKDGNYFIDLETEFRKLEKLSEELAKLSNTAGVTFEDGIITVSEGYSKDASVINLNLSQFINANTAGESYIKGIDLLGGGTLTINVTVDTETDGVVNNYFATKFRGYTTQYGPNGTTKPFGEASAEEKYEYTDKGNVLWNFVDENGKPYDGTMYFNGVWMGSVLAPKSTLTFNQNLDGNAIADNITINAESHRWDFNGKFPAEIDLKEISDEVEGEVTIEDIKLNKTFETPNAPISAGFTTTVFGLYSDPACTNLIAKSNIIDNGTGGYYVDFREGVEYAGATLDLDTATTYFLKEISTVPEYNVNTKVYYCYVDNKGYVSYSSDNGATYHDDILTCNNTLKPVVTTTENTTSNTTTSATTSNTTTSATTAPNVTTVPTGGTTNSSETTTDDNATTPPTGTTSSGDTTTTPDNTTAPSGTTVPTGGTTNSSETTTDDNTTTPPSGTTSSGDTTTSSDVTTAPSGTTVPAGGTTDSSETTTDDNTTTPPTGTTSSGDTTTSSDVTTAPSGTTVPTGGTTDSSETTTDDNTTTPPSGTTSSGDTTTSSDVTTAPSGTTVPTGGTTDSYETTTDDNTTTPPTGTTSSGDTTTVPDVTTAPSGDDTSASNTTTAPVTSPDDSTTTPPTTDDPSGGDSTGGSGDDNDDPDNDPDDPSGGDSSSGSGDDSDDPNNDPDDPSGGDSTGGSGDDSDDPNNDPDDPSGGDSSSGSGDDTDDPNNDPDDPSGGDSSSGSDDDPENDLPKDPEGETGGSENPETGVTASVAVLMMSGSLAVITALSKKKNK